MLHLWKPLSASLTLMYTLYMYMMVHVYPYNDFLSPMRPPSLSLLLPPQVSELSDSPDHEEVDAQIQEVSYGSYATGGGDESHESFETSGGLSTSHTEQ